MIKEIIGGIGSGKTLTAVKEIITRERKCFVNFEIEYKGATRLKTEHIVKEVWKEKGKTKLEVNWDFWNDLIKKGILFDIYIDEAHNVMNSRRSGSNWNINFTKWMTQIRKILGQSEENHLYLLTQRLNSIDIVARELCTEIIYCQKIKSLDSSKTTILKGDKKVEKVLNNIWIVKTYFKGTYCTEKFNAYIENYTLENDGRSVFLGNPFFKYYDSYSLVIFGDEVYV